ncbi:hypothetical protein BRARA_K00364, partial [Brassica rapa]
TAPADVVAVNDRLPSRLFATDRYPSNRNNCYASLEYLLLVRDVLEGSEEMERLLCSCFGSLFRLPVRRCAFSGKMVHGLLSRQLVTKKRFEMWPVFGGFPTRFGLPEFAHVTGLPCGEFEAGYELFGGRRNLNLDDLAAMVVTEDSMSPGKKLRLCLIIIVDGKLDKFFAFQWGRESFWWTISTMIPPKKVLGKCDDPEGLFCSLLRQESKFLLGFPLALQLRGLKKELEKLNKVVEKQGRMLKKYKSKSGGKFSTAKLGSLRRRKKSGVSLEEGNLFGRSDHDGDDDRMEDLDSRVMWLLIRGYLGLMALAGQKW